MCASDGGADCCLAVWQPAGDTGEAQDASAAEPAGQAVNEEKSAEAGTAADVEQPAPQKKKKLKKHDLQVVNKAAYQLAPASIDAFKNDEYEMSVQDRQIRELQVGDRAKLSMKNGRATNFRSTTLQEKKNDLEAYIYTMRDKVSTGELQDYISQADKDKFLPMLDEMENWLYEEEAETGRLRWLCGCCNFSTGAWGSGPVAPRLPACLLRGHIKASTDSAVLVAVGVLDCVRACMRAQPTSRPSFPSLPSCRNTATRLPSV